MKILICKCCNSKFEHKYKNKLYCSLTCQIKSNPKKVTARTCEHCKIEFLGVKNSKFCCQDCFYKNRSDHLLKIHEAKRKYPQIEGLNRCQIFRKFNPDKNREELNRDNIKRTVLIQYLGGKCCKCGYDTDLRALQLDHINSDGHVDRKLKGRSGKIYRYYVKYLEEAKNVLQVLCSNCHSIKSIEEKMRKK
jgi:hypothetical protein